MFINIKTMFCDCRMCLLFYYKVLHVQILSFTVYQGSKGETGEEGLPGRQGQKVKALITTLM